MRVKTVAPRSLAGEDLDGRPAGHVVVARAITAAAAGSVVTRLHLSARPGQVWDGLMFYEQIEPRPPLVLRLLLPLPVRTEGRKSEPGDVVTCHYRRGHLIKRVTRAIPGRTYAFEIIEQRLALGGGIEVLGGSYALDELANGATEVTLTTRYVTPHRPRWLWEPIEKVVCHSFHRHILSAMRDLVSR